MLARGIYSIGALARMLAVSPSTLRTWEERYAVVVPERSPSSQRLYTRDHLEQLRFVCEQMNSGLSAADAHRTLAERLRHDPRSLGADLHDSAEHAIMIVERDPYGAELAEYFLRTEGYAVHIARTVADAHRIVNDRPVDLAIVDLMIGSGSGLQLCRELESRVPVLAVSALDQHDGALEAGALAFVRKPFESLALTSATRDLIGTSAIARMTSGASAGIPE